MKSLQGLTDEDVHRAVAVRLCASGYDAMTTPEVNRLGESDESQLAWAAQDSRVLLSFNVSDFARLHNDWIREGRHHCGIVVSAQRPIGDVVRRLLHLAHVMDREQMCDRLEFLTNW